MNARKLAYCEQFGVKGRKARAVLNLRLLDQLDACKDDCARRILLGVSASSQLDGEKEEPVMGRLETFLNGNERLTEDTLRITLPAGEMAEIYKALDWVAEQTGLAPNDRAGQLLAWAIDANAERQ